MPNNELNNPVARLRFFVDQAKQISPSTSLRDGWAKLCGNDPDDLVAVLSSISSFSILVAEARAAVERLDGYEKSLYFRPIERFEHMLSQINLNQQWQSVIGYFDETTVYGLSITSDILSKFSKEKPLEEHSRTDLLDQISKLTKEVLESDFPEELKAFLLEQLEQFRSALLNYQIFGTAKLKDTVERAAGAFIVNYKGFLKYMDKPTVKKIIQVLTTLANAISVYKGGEWLSEGFVRLLSGGQ